jgi:integrase
MTEHWSDWLPHDGSGLPEGLYGRTIEVRTTGRLHDLRHAAAALIIEQGGDLFAVSKALGHSQMRTTERYASLYESTQRELSEGVARLLEGDHD